MCAWCHGAPGVALGRLDSLRFLDDAAMREDIATAVDATLAGGFGKGHSLCHGDIGNLEILALAAEIRAPRDWSTASAVSPEGSSPASMSTAGGTASSVWGKCPA